MGTTVIVITTLIIAVGWLAMILGQKWGKDSRREEEEAKKIHIDDFLENDFFAAYKDDDDHRFI
jgi:uncharacterized membrane protein